MATPYNTHGATLELGDSTAGASSSYTPIAALGKWNFPERSIDTFVVTSHSDAARRKIPGQVTMVGDIEAELIFDPADSTHIHTGSGIQQIFENKATRDFRAKFPSVNNLKWQFVGMVAKLGKIEMNVNGHLVLPVTLEVDGDVTISAVA